jgi:hypothetical protein
MLGFSIELHFPKSPPKTTDGFVRQRVWLFRGLGQSRVLNKPRGRVSQRPYKGHRLGIHLAYQHQIKYLTK